MDGFENKLLVNGWVGRLNPKLSICILANTLGKVGSNLCKLFYIVFLAILSLKNFFR